MPESQAKIVNEWGYQMHPSGSPVSWDEVMGPPNPAFDPPELVIETSVAEPVIETSVIETSAAEPVIETSVEGPRRGGRPRVWATDLDRKRAAQTAYRARVRERVGV